MPFVPVRVKIVFSALLLLIGAALPVVYLLWAGLVLLMYPICRWFASVKANHRHPLLSYL